MLRISFTGHRPDKLGGYDWNTPKNKAIMKALSDKIYEVSGEEDIDFICGGALGIDQMAFDICKKFRDTDYGVTIEVAIPFSKQACKWIYENVKTYEIQLSQADKCTYVDRLDDYKIKGYEEDIYYPAKMQKRNEYMVDNSDVIIAVWDGTSGGTANCVKYAKKLGKKIIVINPKEI